MKVGHSQELEYWSRAKAYSYLLTELDRELLIAHGMRRLLSDQENAGYLNLLRTKIIHLTPVFKKGVEEVNEKLAYVDEIEQEYTHGMIGPKGLRETPSGETLWKVFKELERLDIELRRITGNSGVDFRIPDDPDAEVLSE